MALLQRKLGTVVLWVIFIQRLFRDAQILGAGRQDFWATKFCTQALDICGSS
jgi:hypothetical protein